MHTPVSNTEHAVCDERAPTWFVESVVVGAVLTVLCVLGVPGMRAAQERASAQAAYDYLSAVQMAQERYRIRHEGYATRLADLNLHATAPADFRVGRLRVESRAEGGGGWTLAMSRRGSSAGYVRYTLVFDDQGFDPVASTVDRFFDLPFQDAP